MGRRRREQPLFFLQCQAASRCVGTNALQGPTYSVGTLLAGSQDIDLTTIANAPKRTPAFAQQRASVYMTAMHTGLDEIAGQPGGTGRAAHGQPAAVTSLKLPPLLRQVRWQRTCTCHHLRSFHTLDTLGGRCPSLALPTATLRRWPRALAVTTKSQGRSSPFWVHKCMRWSAHFFRKLVQLQRRICTSPYGKHDVNGVIACLLMLCRFVRTLAIALQFAGRARGRPRQPQVLTCKLNTGGTCHPAPTYQVPHNWRPQAPI